MSLFDTRNFLRAVSLSLAAAAIVACGGGSGGDGVNNPPPSGGNPPPATPTTATVAVVLKDGLIDEFCSIYADVERVELLGDDGRITLVEYANPSVEGEGRFDLLELRNGGHLLDVATDVPVGEYEKIRMTLAQLALAECVDSPAGPVDEPEADWELLKLPGNGKLDLVPRDGISVIGGATLVIEIDMDMHKSLHLHQTGQGNGKWQFRPVIFVAVAPDSSRLVRIYGEVRDFADLQSPFELCPIDPMAPTDDGRDMSEDDDSGRCVDVFLPSTPTETKRVFNDAGDAVGPDSVVMEGDRLTAIGFLGLHDDDDDDDGHQDDLKLDAVVLHLGDPGFFKTLFGSVATPFRDPNNFLFDADETGSSAADLIDVAYQMGPILDLSDGSETDASVIQPGAGLEVNGVFTRIPPPAEGEPSIEVEPFKATLIVVNEVGMLPEVSLLGGTITDIRPDEDGDDNPVTREIDVTVAPDPATCVKTAEATRYIEIIESDTGITTTERTFEWFFDEDPEIGAEIGDDVDVFGSNEVVDEVATGCVIADTIQKYVLASTT